MSTKEYVDAKQALLKILKKEPTFGELLKSLRLCDGYTQRELASKIQTSIQDISDIENGRKSISAVKAKKLAKALGYSPESFIRAVFQDELDRYKLKLRVDVHAA